MTYFKNCFAHVGLSPEKFFKFTLFQSPRLLLGLNCLDPGQAQPSHSHPDQDKFYYVVEGEGEFMVGEEIQSAGSGVTVWAPAGIHHGVANRGATRLTLLVGIAPAPISK